MGFLGETRAGLVARLSGLVVQHCPHMVYWTLNRNPSEWYKRVFKALWLFGFAFSSCLLIG
jgi:hypothetical protein